ncbi:MAG: hypothetical protein ABW033_06365 [Acidimicrobiia bacterium]
MLVPVDVRRGQPDPLTTQRDICPFGWTGSAQSLKTRAIPSILVGAGIGGETRDRNQGDM